MFPRARPVVPRRLHSARRAAAAAQLGDADTVLLAFVASVPLVFLFAFVQPGGAGVAGVTVTLLGARRGSASRSPTRSCCAISRTAAGSSCSYSSRRSSGTPAPTWAEAARLAQARAVDLAEQDRRGADHRDRGRHARGLVRRALPGLAQRRRRPAARRGGRDSRADRRPLRELRQARGGDQGLRDASSGRTAAPWTGWTRRCSPSSPGTTSGTGCSEGSKRSSSPGAAPTRAQLATSVWFAAVSGIGKSFGRASSPGGKSRLDAVAGSHQEPVLDPGLELRVPLCAGPVLPAQRVPGEPGAAAPDLTNDGRRGR